MKECMCEYVLPFPAQLGSVARGRVVCTCAFVFVPLLSGGGIGSAYTFLLGGKKKVGEMKRKNITPTKLQATSAFLRCWLIMKYIIGLILPMYFEIVNTWRTSSWWHMTLILFLCNRGPDNLKVSPWLRASCSPNNSTGVNQMSTCENK